MSEITALKSYLVGLGFNVDAKTYRIFNDTLKEASHTVNTQTANISGNFLKWQTGIVGMFAGITTAVVTAMEKVSMADQEYRLFGERMFMGTQQARGLKIALDALGPLEAIAFDPELHDRFMQLQKDQRTMSGGLGGDFESTMRDIRDVRFEFTRLQVELQYLTMGVVKEVFKAFGANDFLGTLRQINDWIINNLPKLSKQFADYLVPILKDTWQIGKDIVEVLGLIATEFTNIIGVLSGDSSIEGTSFSFEKMAKAIEHVIGWLHSFVEIMFTVEKAVAPFLGGVLGASGGATLGGAAGFLLGGPAGAATGAAIGGAAGGAGGLLLDFMAHRGAANPGSMDISTLVRAVMNQESGGNPNATSSAGAHGLMQLMPETAKQLGIDINNPADNLRGGTMYLKQMLKHYNGDTYKALQAYNWGPGNMDAYLKTGKGMRGQSMPLETSRYADSVLSRYNKYSSGGVNNSGGNTSITVGDINVNHTNASANDIKQAVLDGVQEAQMRSTQRNLTQLTPVWE